VHCISELDNEIGYFMNPTSRASYTVLIPAMQRFSVARRRRNYTENATENLKHTNASASPNDCT
jgi:hypothetical protein